MLESAEDADVETSSEGYAGRFAGPVGQFFLDVQTRATLELLASWPRASILDVGGGHGQLTGPLVDAGHEVTIYGSAAVCEERVRPWTGTGRARFRSGNLLKTSFADRSFDVVVSYRLLPHVARWTELIAELSRLARLSVVLDYPTSRSVNAVAETLFGLKKKVEGNTRPFTVFRDEEVIGAFATAGLRPTARRPEFFVPMALHRALRSARLSRAIEGVSSALGLTRNYGSPVLARFERDS
ncbi:MAG TPA: methyltransferase domain-containing protein [Vicinamibacteria bacterium]